MFLFSSVAYKLHCVVSTSPLYFFLPLSLLSIHKETSRTERITPDQQNQDGRGNGFSTGKEGSGKCLSVLHVAQCWLMACVLISLCPLSAGMDGKDGQCGKSKFCFFYLTFLWWLSAISYLVLIINHRQRSTLFWRFHTEPVCCGWLLGWIISDSCFAAVCWSLLQSKKTEWDLWKGGFSSCCLCSKEFLVV